MPPADAGFRHVYWLGGGSGAGKSTVARRLAAQHGCTVLGTDDLMTDHGRRMSADNSPLAKAFAAMDMDERWVNRTPEEMLEVAGGEVVCYLLTWVERDVPHAAHHCHVFRFSPDGRIAADRFFCGGRWDAGLLAEMGEASDAG